VSPKQSVNLDTVQSAAAAYAQAEALFSSLGDGAVATDELGRITRINQAGLAILGYKESEMLGKWFPKAFAAFKEDGSPISPIDRPITRSFLTGKPVSTTALYRMKSGNLLPVSVTVSPLVLGDKPIGAVEVFRDISLEYEVDRMKSDFISLASHQLRTPLSAIKTYTHMLLDGFMGPMSPAQKRSLRTVITASNRMNELISTLLNVSRIESGNVIISPKRINLNLLVNDVFKELAMAVADKQLSLRAKLPTQPVFIKADALITKEIIINLVSNATKYTPEKGHITVSLHKLARKARITVKDTGLGIPVGAQDQIFTKFFRAHNITQQETTGTGLGLYLVKGLVEALGGKVWFTSVENEGTTFFVDLPLTYKAAPKTRADRMVSK
jgi:PAS domain S-box-containing protein